MAKRSITDEEIGLIRAMTLINMKNKDIQFYFNRQERAVNSGRISQIRDRTYGPEVPTASETSLQEFLRTFKPAEIGAIFDSNASRREPTLAERALAFFVKSRGGWQLGTHETDRIECKETFCLKPEGRFADPLRSIAGLANNSGGFIFFGVSELPDGTLRVAGLRDEAFANTDPAEINRCLAGALHPVPTFTSLMIEFDGLSVGVIYVEKHNHPPVMALKNVNSEVKEGTVYFRYVGETRAIKPGELQQIISFREQKAVAEFSRRMARIAVGSVATLDLDSGKVEGKDGSFLINEDLLPKIQFLRHGEFVEEKGAPSLRLIGDVSPIKEGKKDTIRSNITSESVLLNFLKGNPVAEPLQYIMHSAHTARAWLPLFYYLYSSDIPLAEVVKMLTDERATYTKRRTAAIARLSGTGTSAFNKPIGKVQALLASAMKGELQPPSKLADVGPISQAIQAIGHLALVDFIGLKKILLTAYELTNGSSEQHQAARSLVYRAACRLDELEFSEPARRSDPSPPWDAGS